MLGGAGGAERGHGVGETQLGQRHHVHVALGDQHVALVAQSLARLEQAVQLAALAEHRRLGRVEVFRLALVQHAAAKGDHLALEIADGEHDAFAETVVALLVAGSSPETITMPDSTSSGSS